MPVSSKSGDCELNWCGAGGVIKTDERSVSGRTGILTED